MNSPQVPISWGELFDKITILQIKLENLTLKNALENVEQELKKTPIHSYAKWSQNYGNDTTRR